MSVTRGNKQVSLSMNTTFNENSAVTIMMREYLDEALIRFKDSKIDTNKRLNS